MHTLTQILRFTFDWQIDVAVLYLFMFVVLTRRRSHATRRGAGPKVSPAVRLAALGLTLAGGLIALWIGDFLGHSSDAALLALFTARMTIWGVTAYSGWALLSSAVRIALPRAKRRAPTDADQLFHQANLTA